MVIEGLSLSQNFAHKVVALAALEAVVVEHPELTVIRTKEIINLWLTDHEEKLIEFAAEIEQGHAYIAYYPSYETFGVIAFSE